LIAGRVYISDHDHVLDDPVLSSCENKKLISKPVVIEDGCWLGEGCVILKGVRIGKRSVIGANAVVTKDIPEYSIAAGVPAKVIKKINFNKPQ
jgi:acetyltransferase-like isoleucine patch superfamily enzyme